MNTMKKIIKTLFYSDHQSLAKIAPSLAFQFKILKEIKDTECFG